MVSRAALPFVFVSSIVGHATAGDDPPTPWSTFIEVEKVLIAERWRAPKDPPLEIIEQHPDLPPPYFVGLEPSLDRTIFVPAIGDALRAVEEALVAEYGATLAIDSPRPPIAVCTFEAGMLGSTTGAAIFGTYHTEPRLVIATVSPNDEYATAGIFRYSTALRLDDLKELRGKDPDSIAPWIRLGLTEHWNDAAARYNDLRAARGLALRFPLNDFVRVQFPTLSEALANDEIKPLREWLNLNATELTWYLRRDQPNQRERLKLARAYSWAIFDYLRTRGGGQYREALRRAVVAEIDSSKGTETLARELVLESDSDWADLDAEFREWIFSDLRDRAVPRKGKG